MDWWFPSEPNSNTNLRWPIYQNYTIDMVMTTKPHVSDSQWIRWTMLLPATLQTHSSKTYNLYRPTCRLSYKKSSRMNALQLCSLCSWVRQICQDHIMMPFRTTFWLSRRLRTPKSYRRIQLLKWELIKKMLRSLSQLLLIKPRLLSMRWKMWMMLISKHTLLSRKQKQMVTWT